jgi:hypothetical protein
MTEPTEIEMITIRAGINYDASSNYPTKSAILATPAAYRAMSDLMPQIENVDLNPRSL